MCSSAFLHPSQVKSRSKSNLINSQHKKKQHIQQEQDMAQCGNCLSDECITFQSLLNTQQDTRSGKRTWRIDDVQVNVLTLYVQVLESTKHETRQFSESAYHTNENSGRQIIGVKYALQHRELCTTTTTKTTITANSYACVYPKTR